MANYEELYNNAKRKYDSAVSDKSYWSGKISEYTSEKKKYEADLVAKKADLKNIRDKKAKITETKTSCDTIINKEYQSMKKDVSDITSAMRKIVTSDIGDPDLSSIYSDDFTSTRNDLGDISSDLEGALRKLETQEQNAQKAVNNCQNSLNTAKNNLRNANNNYNSACSRANSAYGEMMSYKAKWEAEG